MKKKKLILILSILFIGTLIFYYKHYNKPNQPNADGVWVQTVKTEESTLPLETNAIGTLTARSVEITPEISGHVKKILFKDGDFVEENAPLMQLEDDVYKTKAELASAKEQYSKSQYERIKILSKRGIVSKQALEQAEAEYKERHAELREALVMVDKAQLEAPFSGRLGQGKVSRGDYLPVGQSVVTLTDTKHLHIEYSVPEKYLPLLKLGQIVKIQTVAYPDKVFEGRVAFISPTINTANRSVSLYATVDNEFNLLTAGMFVNVKQSLASTERVIVIPARSLMPILEGEQVFKIVNGKAMATTVVIGRRFKDNIQVLQGLAKGDQIITDGQLKVRNGMPVRVVEEK